MAESIYESKLVEVACPFADPAKGHVVHSFDVDITYSPDPGQQASPEASVTIEIVEFCWIAAREFVVPVTVETRPGFVIHAARHIMAAAAPPDPPEVEFE